MTNNKLNLLNAIESLNSATDNFIRDLSFSTPDFLETQIENQNLDVSGVYFIEIRSEKYLDGCPNDWKEKFVTFWDKAEFKGKFTPQSKKKRLNAHDSVGEWTPLYIGKCKNIRKRLNDHKTLTFFQKTRGIKLDARGIYEQDSFRVSHVEIPLDVYDEISEKIESYYRNEINPLVGI
ncbi:conserved hypothetical protein [Vibrio coralliirubri]|uniref:GIY-YIG nuclease family protein n=1 Tax=Vibrio coralliirubri TaxID=1516159 RepID=UPI0006308B4D|nr:GIY-YIG nuclease family protein [Vibrio coralliirubri]CDT81026.1 conserved hypothetical protein [Vibrio coralliirubri]